MNCAGSTEVGLARQSVSTSESFHEKKHRLLDAAPEKLTVGWLANGSTNVFFGRSRQGVDTIHVSVLSPDLMTPVLDRATEASVPVLTFGSDAPNTKRVRFHGIRHRAGAQTETRTLANLTRKQGKIAIVTGAGSMPGTSSTSQTYLERSP